MIPKMSWKLNNIIIIILLSYSIIPTFIDRLIWRRRFTRDREVALTFDDGPGIYTEAILDLLLKYKVTASFFVVTDNVEKYPNIVKRIIKEGHEICLHSRAHKMNIFRSYKAMDKDFIHALDELEKMGVRPKYYRPPWGVFNLDLYRLIKKYNLRKVIWNVMVGDWRKFTTPEILSRKLIRRTKGGSIICVHDAGTAYGPKNLIKALEIYLPKTLAKGYRFIRIDDIYN